MHITYISMLFCINGEILVEYPSKHSKIRQDLDYIVHLQYCIDWLYYCRFESKSTWIFSFYTIGCSRNIMVCQYSQKLGGHPLQTI